MLDIMDMAMVIMDMVDMVTTDTDMATDMVMVIIMARGLLNPLL